MFTATEKTEYAIVKIRRWCDIPGYEEDRIEYLVYLKGFGWWLFTGSDARRVDSLNPEKVKEILEKAEDDYTV